MQLPVWVLNADQGRRILKCANPVVLWAAQHSQVFFCLNALGRVISNPAIKEMPCPKIKVH